MNTILTTVLTKTHGELRIGDKFIDPINGEIKYPLHNDTHTIMFVTDRVLMKMISRAEEHKTDAKSIKE